MKELIKSIAQKHLDYGIEFNEPATNDDIIAFEKQIGFALPPDFKEFYLTCNGFGCTEDIFNMVPLSSIREYPSNFGAHWFYFSEYMISSDSWGLRCTPSGHYEIFNAHSPTRVMTSSLKEFLERFLKGNVFDDGGLYAWEEELGIK